MRRFIGAVLGVLIVNLLVGAAGAQNDIQAPRHEVLAVDPQRVDIANGDAEFKIRFRIIDDLSGYDGNGTMTIHKDRFQAPIIATVRFTSDSRISGNELDGEYENTVRVNRFTPTGQYIFDELTLTDKAGNTVTRPYTSLWIGNVVPVVIIFDSRHTATPTIALTPTITSIPTRTPTSTRTATPTHTMTPTATYTPTPFGTPALTLYLPLIGRGRMAGW